MSDLQTLEQGFLETLLALEDDLDKIVIVGGWCPYLYAKYLWHKEISNIPTTTDDTLNRFLGRQLACNRIEAFEILLENPARINIKHSEKNLHLNMPRPETFLYHKGITFVMRSYEPKRDKDLMYVYFILKFCPDQEALLSALAQYKKHELFKSFRSNLKKYMADVSKPGYKMLRPFVRRWVEEKKINEEISEIFGPIFALIR